MNWKNKTWLSKAVQYSFWILLALCGTGAILGSAVLLVVHYYRYNGPTFQVAPNQAHTNSGAQTKPVGLWYSLDDRSLVFYDLNTETSKTIYTTPKDYSLRPVNYYQVKAVAQTTHNTLFPFVISTDGTSSSDELLFINQQGITKQRFVFPVGDSINPNLEHFGFTADMRVVAWCDGKKDLKIYTDANKQTRVVSQPLACTLGGGQLLFSADAKTLYFGYGFYEYMVDAPTQQQYEAMYKKDAQQYGVGEYALDLVSLTSKLVHPAIEYDGSDGVMFATETLGNSGLIMRTDIKNPKLVNFYSFPVAAVFVPKVDFFNVPPSKSILFDYPTAKVNSVVLSTDGQYAYTSPTKLQEDKITATCTPNVYRTDITATPPKSELAYESPKCADVVVASGKKFLIREEDSLFAVGADRVPKPVVLRQRYEQFGVWQ